MKPLFLILNIFTFTCTVFGQVNLDSILVAYYNFDNNISDQSVNANNGTLQGAPIFMTGVNEKCLSFDGQDDYVELNNSLQLDNEFSISAWVKTSDTNKEWQTVISKYESNQYGPYWFGLHYDKVNFWISDGNGGYVDFDSEITLEEDIWYHIIWTGSNGEGKFYINCALDDSVESIPSLTQNNDKVTIGRQALYLWNVDNYADWNGEIDEMRIYNRVLTADEIGLLCKGETVSATSVSTAREINIFPSPFRNNLNIIYEGTSNGPIEIKIYDILGHQIFYKKTMIQNNLMVNSENFPNGVLLIHLHTEDGSYTFKAIKLE